MLSVWLVNGILVALTVIIHYEFLLRLTLLMPRLNIRYRARIVLGVFIALVAHALEVWIFAASYYFMHHHDKWGELTGNFTGTFYDCVYFSFTAYTTLGTGDIVPLGDLRYLTGLEALTGLVLITWTASFLYLEMSRHWDQH
jgi:Ion channel